MRAETETRITAWETCSADDGYDGLHALAETGFSGAAVANGTWLFMLDGRAIGLFDGPIETFADAPITTYVAPHPALPALFVMREQGGETRAKYYTGDTSLADAAETLSSGGFTGYVELSENVLSGEYYLVYHRGRSMAVAFVGGQDRLLTDDEARTRANEEVGIYEVRAANVGKVDLPEPTEADSNPITSSGSDPERVADGNRPAGPSTTDPTEPTRGVEPESEPDDPVGSTAGTTRPTPPSDSMPESDTDTSPQREREGEAGDDTPTTPTARWGSVVEAPVEERFAAEQQWRQTVRIPSLETDRSALASSDRSRDRDQKSDSAPSPDIESTSDVETAEGTAASKATPTTEETIAEPDTLGERRAREAAEAETEAEADRLRREVASLRERLERLETPDAAESPSEDRTESAVRAEPIQPTRALSETDLFVRYAAAAEPTLEAARSDRADRSAVEGNLRLERHTGFDPTGVTVEDRPFETFLEDRLEYRFTDWAVRQLLFDLRETGHEDDLAELYDALPRIDRIDFGGTIVVDEDTRRSFDVVFRDRMGKPLVVADCIGSREPIDEEQVASFVTAANETVEVATDLAGAMLVTTSFFDPGAFETATEATRSGLLDRSARESYVTVSRSCGYHLCLIEMRDAFHVRVPEL